MKKAEIRSLERTLNLGFLDTLGRAAGAGSGWNHRLSYFLTGSFLGEASINFPSKAFLSFSLASRSSR